MAELKIKPIAAQYIAALGDEQAAKGTNAESWGLWVVDPGPRGVRLTQSGKGGINYVLDTEHGIELPRCLQIEFSKVVQVIGMAKAWNCPPNGCGAPSSRDISTASAAMDL